MNVNEIWEAILKHFDSAGPIDLIIKIVSTLLVIFVIIVAVSIIQLIMGKILRVRLKPQSIVIVKKVIKYIGVVLVVFVLFKSLGLNTSALLGTAGVIGIGLGFAAQTSLSNLISGFFLLSEKTFQPGDVISLDDILGVVLSVDLLSVKVRTFDNRYIRIPNETLIKSNMTNLTRFPVRRLDVTFNVTYQADLERVRDILMDIASKNPYVLDNPEPFFRVDQFDRAGPLINMNVWFEKNNVLETKTAMYMMIQKRFAEEGIELPYQKVDVKVDGGGFGEDSAVS